MTTKIRKPSKKQRKELVSYTSWFDAAIKTLGVDDRSPGWPDDFGKALESVLRKKKVPTLSLFTGAGGLDIGFHNTGYHSSEMVEVERSFINTLEENTGNNDIFSKSLPRCIDIREYNPNSNFNVDFIVGGPPCQTFSSAGRRASGVLGTDDPRGMLFVEYVRLLEKLQPEGFLFENVYGITGAQGGEPWQAIQAAFQEAGYTLSYKVLDAADYGVPQHRERLFIIGLKNKKFKFPQPTHGPDSQDARPHYSSGLAVTNVPQNEDLKEINGRYGHLLKDIPPGLNYSFFTHRMGHPNPVFAWRSKFSDFLYKADPEFPVRAIKAQGGQYTGPFSWENRYFTVDELKRLQTFPDDFRIKGGRQVAIHQIGNSVPPQMARILGLAILDQVFNARLPFKIEYMDDDYTLSFRSQKRHKTSYYQKKAKEVIANIPSKKKVKVGNRKVEIIRYLGPKFEWSDKKKSGYQRVEIIKRVTDGTLEIATSGRKRKVFNICIVPTNNAEWHIPYSKIKLRSEGCSKEHLTMLWKALEEEIRASFGVADLVQLFGYYQYKPKVKVSFYYNSSTDKDFWDFVQVITEKSGTVEIDLKSPSLFNYTASDKTELHLKELKNFGYEVRNKNTNPQIQEGTYLVPYFFPTLTKDSVQLRKKL